MPDNLHTARNPADMAEAHPALRGLIPLNRTPPCRITQYAKIASGRHLNDLHIIRLVEGRDIAIMGQDRRPLRGAAGRLVDQLWVGVESQCDLPYA